MKMQGFFILQQKKKKGLDSEQNERTETQINSEQIKITRNFDIYEIKIQQTNLKNTFSIEKIRMLLH